jgi:Ca-activated chloride channel homolog
MVQALPKISKWRTLAIVPLFFGGAGWARDGAGRQVATFSSGVEQVEVYVTVTDSKGEPVTGLTAADFQVSEDGKPQAVTTFAAGEFPLSVAVTLDRSFSMAGERLSASRRAARTFVESLRSDDEVMVLAVGSEIETVTPPVPAREAATIGWEGMTPWGSTLLYDAAGAALDTIATRRGRRALLLISDGVDRGSDLTATQLIQRARGSGVLVYPVAIGGTRPAIFAELASVTGGRALFIQDAQKLESELVQLARELRFQYLLGYAPAESGAAAAESRGDHRAPRWHAIQVAVSRPGVTVRARDGYF